ncbi:hypothetical protein BWQ96_02205 [Gracilariopsis chorda]|uniref:Uncharacterized protein n=1 Tax=Gracilariopsis chorda TaxID=448386 RepID=A0A2V3J0V9_9FLOR|nr:hypothetical protein BWQ96_02205 [Gracilariopsis chorda]|eukprot:PXF48014.1 hypothetical protein BWQ96_02205 [Gracilariopsis chorda]
MGLEGGVDYTPLLTISTIQFENEVVNTVATSLIVVFLLTNLGSIINRLVFISDKTQFNYRSFLRAFIFMHSDDITRLAYWWKGKNPYLSLLNPGGSGGGRAQRMLNRVQRRRLLLPVCARILLVVSSIASIALTIPGKKTFSSCGRADYEPQMGSVSPNFSEEPGGVLTRLCRDIPINTKRGDVSSKVSYCSTVLPLDTNALFEESTAVIAGYWEQGGLLISGYTVNGRSNLVLSFVEWQRGVNGNIYRSHIRQWSPERHLGVCAEGISRDRNRACTIQSTRNDSIQGVGVTLGLLSCDDAPDLQSGSSLVAGAVRDSLGWVKFRSTIQRSKLTGGEFRIPQQRECPVVISVERPVVNIVPLLVALVMMYTLNYAVNETVSHKGDIMDALFLLVKETLGHDCTSNPLEDSGGEKEVDVLQLQRFECADGRSAHIGFLRGRGDRVVEEFSDGKLVHQCYQTRAQGPRVPEVAERVEGRQRMCGLCR